MIKIKCIFLTQINLKLRERRYSSLRNLDLMNWGCRQERNCWSCSQLPSQSGPTAPWPGKDLESPQLRNGTQELVMNKNRKMTEHAWQNIPNLHIRNRSLQKSRMQLRHKLKYIIVLRHPTIKVIWWVKECVCETTIHLNYNSAFR